MKYRQKEFIRELKWLIICSVMAGITGMSVFLMVCFIDTNCWFSILCLWISFVFIYNIGMRTRTIILLYKVAEE